MKLDHPELERLLQRAYSGEKAAAFAYIGHARTLRDPAAKHAVKQIEEDEWCHRRNVRAIMERHGVPVSRWYEVKLHVIGRLISASCRVIGRFMPFFFAGKLESGNVCEYFVMMRHFHSLGITEHDAVLYEMGMKEKEHELYFLEQIRASRLLPFFQRFFGWGAGLSANDVDLANKAPLAQADGYCANSKSHAASPGQRQP